MDNKRYQIFLSSTYADLQEERQLVIQALMKMDCIPAGMELFPAMDEEQFEFIKRIIDDSDYYLLIVGGRYGSLTPEGISFTEKEYDYAIEKGKKVIAFIHGEPEKIPVDKSELDPIVRNKYERFRNKIKLGRLVSFWSSALELKAAVSLDLPQTMKAFPAVGWVRGGTTSNTELLAEINELRKRNDVLEAELEQMEKECSIDIDIDIDNLASGEESFHIRGEYEYKISADGAEKAVYKAGIWNVEITWDKIFSLIGPYLLTYQYESQVYKKLSSSLFTASKFDGRKPCIYEEYFHTIRFQLHACKYIVLSHYEDRIGSEFFWSLSDIGKNRLYNLKTIKSRIK